MSVKMAVLAPMPKASEKHGHHTVEGCLAERAQGVTQIVGQIAHVCGTARG